MEKSHPNVKHDWYQSETHVVLTIVAKQVNEEDVEVEFTNSQVTCNAKLADGSDFKFHLSLCHPIIASDTKWKVHPSKIEIKMKKAFSIMWKTLECVNSEGSSSDQSAADVKLYPSSKAEKKDWDRIAVDIKKAEESEQPEGEEALNKMFQKIYCDGSDEVRKAMNKSFLESAGTVLSTSWNEVGSKKVDVKPPDSCEYRKWN